MFCAQFQCLLRNAFRHSHRAPCVILRREASPKCTQNFTVPCIN